MAHLLFSGPITSDPYEPGNVDHWLVHSGRLARTRLSPSRISAAITFLEAFDFTIEAVSPVGLSFSGTTQAFRQAEVGVRGGTRPWGLDPFRLDTRVLRRPAQTDKDDALFGREGADVLAIEIQPEAIPLTPTWSRRELLRLAAATGLVGSCVPKNALGQNLPTPTFDGEGVTIAVVDSGWEPTAASPTVRVLPGMAGLKAERDERGHGTAVIEHVLAQAPGTSIVVSKYVDNSGFRNYPVAAFQRALWGCSAEEWNSPEKRILPDIVLCSWAMVHFSEALQLEIACAVGHGVTVIFAAGNGDMTDMPDDQAMRHRALAVEELGNLQAPAGTDLARRFAVPGYVHAVSHPDAIVVGGASPPSENPRSTSVATSYNSKIYIADSSLNTPARSIPDVCGWAAQPPDSILEPPQLEQVRTSVNSTLARQRKPLQSNGRAWARSRQRPPFLGLSRPDGRVWTGGTSVAAAKVAGVAAQLLQKHPGLSPTAVRNVLAATARDVTLGKTNPPPEPGWDAKTGYGVVDVSSVLAALLPQGTPFLRNTIDDRDGTAERQTNRGSPDIIIRREAELHADDLQIRLGIAMKHEPQLDLLGSPTDTHHIYVRISNGGSLPLSNQEVFFFELTERAGAVKVTPRSSVEISLEPAAFQVLRGIKLPTRPTGVMVVVGAPLPERIFTHQESWSSVDEIQRWVVQYRHAGVWWLGGAQ